MAGRRPQSKLDLASVAGLICGLGGILIGQKLEGGSPATLLQGTAALIVLGGTVGAVLISTPLATFLRALGRVKSVFFEAAESPAAVSEEIVDYATKARKSGIVSLELEAETIANPFLRKAMNLAVDGTDLQEIRKMMELEIQISEQAAEDEAKVFESAGGFSPTIGIIGAVLGLIQVMHDLGDTSKLGEGIAVAFVATIYGVGLANLFCLPMANKIKARARVEVQIRELMLEGVMSIVEGLNPKLIRSKLEAFHQGAPAPKRAAPPPQPAGAPKPVEG